LLQGDTRNLPLTGLLQTLEMGREVGVLTVFHQRVERSFLLGNRSISVIGPAAGGPSPLRPLLDGLGILPAGEFDNVIAAFPSSGAPGDALLQSHVITPEQVRGAIREQLLESTYEIFEWSGARYRFEVTAVPDQRLLFGDPEITRATAFPIQSVLMEVGRREDEWTRIREAIPVPHQIYRVLQPDGLAGFTTPEIPDADRMQGLLRLFNGELPLSSVLRSSAVPDFFIFSILRVLLERGLVLPIPVEDKRLLAERLRTRRQTASVAAVYRSILDDDPDDDEIRRRLMRIVERSGGHERELADHYGMLAASAARRGDAEGRNSALLRQLELAPRSLSVREGALRHLAEDQSSRDFARALSDYLEKAGGLSQELRAAEFLLQLADEIGGSTSLHESAGDLLARHGRGEEAVEAWERALEESREPDRLATLHRICEKIRRVDASRADRWLGRVAVGGGASSARVFPLGRLVAALGVALVGFIGLQEFQAFSDRADTIARAEVALRSGDRAEAREQLDAFRDAHPLSLATAGLERFWSEHGSGVTPDTGESLPAEPPVAAPFHFERFLSELRSLKRQGAYDEALAHALAVPESRFPTEVRGSLQAELAALDGYLRGAADLHSKAETFSEAGDRVEAGRLYRRLAREFPHAAVTREARVPLVLEVLPPDCTVTVDGESVDATDPIRVPTGALIEIRARAAGFEPFTAVVDPLSDPVVPVHLQRRSEWKLRSPAPIDAEPLITDALVITGDRDGKVIARRRADGSTAWTYEIPGIGDVVGSLRVWQDSVVFAATDGAVHRLGLEDGRCRYRVPLGDGGLPRGACSPITPNGRTAVATSASRVHWIDVRSGRTVWEARLPFDCGHSPVVEEERILVSSDSGGVACLRGSDGTPLWDRRFEVGLATPGRSHDGAWIVGTRDRRLIALEVATGLEIWELPLAAEPTGAVSLVESGGCVTTSRGDLHFFHPADGRQLWTTAGRAGFRSAPVIRGDEVITVDEGGTILVQGLARGEPRWSHRLGAAPESPLTASHGAVVVVDEESTLHVLPLVLPLVRPPAAAAPAGS